MSTKKPQQVAFGEWTPYHSLTTENQKVFDETLEGFLGVDYRPESVATQVVTGINYRFKCKAFLHKPAPLQWEAIVSIYAPLGDVKPYVTSIVKVL